MGSNMYIFLTIMQFYCISISFFWTLFLQTSLTDNNIINESNHSAF